MAAQEQARPSLGKQPKARLLGAASDILDSASNTVPTSKTGVDLEISRVTGLMVPVQQILQQGANYLKRLTDVNRVALFEEHKALEDSKKRIMAPVFQIWERHRDRFLDEEFESPDEVVEVFEKFEDLFSGIGMRKAELFELRRSVAGINDQERRIKIAEDSLVDFVKETQRNIACANPRYHRLECFFLQNKLALDEHLAETVSSVRLCMSADVQGLKGVNTAMEHQAGTDVLTRYGQYIDQFCFECKQKFVDAIASARAFHQGGDEMAVVIIFKPGFDNPRMQHALSTTLVQDMANKDIHMFGKDYNKPFCADGVTVNRVPTMLRVGACMGAGTSDQFDIADTAEGAVRTAIYMAAFGNLDARGAVVAKSDPKLRNIPNWRLVDTSGRQMS